MTDIAARRAGAPTLDEAVRAFSDCCAASEEEWTAERVLARLDGFLGTPRFAPIAQTWLARSEFPDLVGALRDLGVAPGPSTEAIFQAAPGAAIRDAIMAPTALHPGANRDPHQGR